MSPDSLYFWGPEPDFKQIKPVQTLLERSCMVILKAILCVVVSHILSMTWEQAKRLIFVGQKWWDGKTKERYCFSGSLHQHEAEVACMHHRLKHVGNWIDCLHTLPPSASSCNSQRLRVTVNGNPAILILLMAPQRGEHKETMTQGKREKTYEGRWEREREKKTCH